MPFDRAERALHLLRCVLAILLLIHGIVRLSLGGVVPFGSFLQEQGFGAAGIWIAGFVTLFELSATSLLAFGPRRFIAPIALVFASIYACGIWLVHWQHGWFVVGAGRNGMEYSVLLISALVLIAWKEWPAFAALLERTKVASAVG